MIADLQPYPIMKDSEVEWLGEVPEHWVTSKIKSLARPGYKTFVDGDWIESPFITSEGIRLIQTGNIGVGEYREKGFRYIGEETFKSFGCTEVTPGDILICRLGEPVARTCLAPHLGKRMITSVDVCILKPRKGVSAQFLVYSMSSRRYLDWVGSLVRGSTRDRVSRSMLGSFSMAIPPPPEQAAIVRFLDHADRRIRRYIRAKQKLIALLEEQKQAIIHQAVTGKIDVRTGQPYPAYKPSGVEWLGDVPEHWNLASLKRISRRWQNGATPPTSEVIFYENGTVPWYGPSSCGTKDEVARPVQYLNEAAFSDGGARFIQGPALLVVVIGATAGRMTLMSKDGSTNQQIKAFEIPPDCVRPRFILRQVRGAESWLRSTASSATIPILDSGVVGRLLCAIPPLVEQEMINGAVHSGVARIDQFVERKRDEISLLHEYRTHLIADVVTGKLEAGEAAANLPKEEVTGDAEESDEEHGIEKKVAE